MPTGSIGPLSSGIPRLSKENFMFSTVCWLVLMENGKGIIEKHPDYIFEKMAMLQMPADIAYGRLDRENQQKVLDWCAAWGYQIPKDVFEYERQLIEGA